MHQVLGLCSKFETNVLSLQILEAFFLYSIFWLFLRAQKKLKFEFVIEAIIIFVKNIKKGIEWYVHFIGKSII